MKKSLLSIGLFAISLFASSSAVFADDECTADLNIEDGTIKIPCIQLIDAEDGNTYSVEMISQRGNSINWEVVVVNTNTSELEVAVETAAEDCLATVELNDDNKGIIILPCLQVEDVQDNTSAEKGVADMYAVLMKQRGSSLNWAVSIVLADFDIVDCVPENANNCKTKEIIYDADNSPGKSDSAKEKAPGQNKQL